MRVGVSVWLEAIPARAILWLCVAAHVGRIKLDLGIAAPCLSGFAVEAVASARMREAALAGPVKRP
jgi:hypothetical protein